MPSLFITPHSDLPLTRQIYQSMRDQIFSGDLPPGQPLPSTRELAAELGISRHTVNEAYDMLLAEGFILTQQGAPTRVADGLRLEMAPPQPDAVPDTPLPSYSADFRTGQPDLRHFPRYLWRQLLAQAAQDLPLSLYGYSGPEGLPALREMVAAWLFRSRGLRVAPRSIFITAGATHALHILAGLLQRPAASLLIEDPCHAGMLHALQGRGWPVRPAPVDSAGLLTAGLDLSQTSAVYVTPSHQFPLGGILPAQRRTALVRLAREHNVYIIEDDYDSEFRYCGAPIAPLVSLDPQQVIYVGTFSKVFYPALRIGYAILPEALREAWCDLRMHSDVQNPPIEQAALANLIATRKLDRHVQKMRKLYSQRRAALLQALREQFGPNWQACGDEAGLHLAVQFPGRDFDGRFVTLCQQNGVRALPLEHFAIQKGQHRDKLLLGYGHLEPAEIQSAVRTLFKVISAL
jgi:GntR family transcriptional regulator/MocR family aminotransferase